MVTEFLGPTLEDIFDICGRQFSLKTTCMIFMQMIQLMKSIHGRDFIHRDIKPDNFLFGYGNRSNQIFAVDFGLAKKYRTHEGHIPFVEKQSLTGTARYASHNAHKGYELSRRDELEAVGYMMINFVTGQLPWEDTQSSNFTQLFGTIGKMKELPEIELMCKSLPPQFCLYMCYVRNLKFDQEPDYDYIEQLIKEIADQNAFRLDDNIFDWATTLSCKDLKYTQLKRKDKIIIKHELTREQELKVAEFQFLNFKHVHDIMKNYYNSRCSIMELD